MKLIYKISEIPEYETINARLAYGNKLNINLALPEILFEVSSFLHVYHYMGSAQATSYLL